MEDIDKLGVLVIFFSVVCDVHALIPAVCANNVTRPGKVCCPVDPNNGMICGGPTRGACRKIYAPKEDVPSVFSMDDRMAWPTKFIQHGCQCEPRFYGVACEQCWFGWTGPDCSKREIKIRRDIRNLSPRDLEIFKDVVRLAWIWPSGYMVLDESKNRFSDPTKKPRFIEASVQYYITFLHYYGARTTLYTSDQDCKDYGILNFNHDGPVFPTWHRFYHLIWERMLEEIAWKVHGIKDFALPFWDWVGMHECDICHNKFIGAPGETDEYGMRIHEGSRFHNLTSYCWETVPGAICIGCQNAGHFGQVTRLFQTLDFPDQNDVQFVLSREDYFVPGERDNPECVSFSMALEGFCGRPSSNPDALWLHNKLHNMIKGDMESTATATNDPFFILHHGTVDKIFSMWYRQHHPSLESFPNKGVRPGHSRDAFMIGIYPLARNGDMLTDVEALGYDYEDPGSIGHFSQNDKGPVYVH